MCGICGVIQVRGQPRAVVDSHVLDFMTDVMEHRGPDDRGVHLDHGVGLGVRRLAIVDVDGGHQPVANERGTIWAIQNGELYNHRTLREQLERDGHEFRSRCDTEVLPHLYEQYGTSLPTKLRGMFGLAVWDGERRRAFLARDRLGIKPLYYAVVADLLVFGSELKSVLASGLVPTELDYGAIDSFLTFGFFAGPSTPFAAVRKLLPGHSLIVEDGHYRTERYWSYPLPAEHSRSLGDTAEALLELLEDSVRMRLMSDVPLGVMLSGGLDSSLIAALMARNMAEPVKTFSVGFFEDGDRNELADARFVAASLGADHHELELSFTSDAVDLPELLWHLDEPLADLSALGFHSLCQLAARHVTVSLSGQGADELFGGYRKHQAAALIGHLGVFRPVVSAGARGVSAVAPASARRALETLGARSAPERLVAMSGKMDGDLRHALYRGPLAEHDGDRALRLVQGIADGVRDEPLPLTLYIDGQLALVDDMLQYFDKASMAHSLEVRVPFLDHHLVEFAATVSAGQKIRGLRTKHVLKKAARGLVPERIIEKRKLGFFGGSTGDWLKAQVAGSLEEFLLEGDLECSEFLDPGSVRRLARRHVEGQDGGRNAKLLLAILTLEVWLQSYPARVTARGSTVGCVRT
jgi:asparagine synthase (glutamine-hydrolysing)